jgi:hypothetical protein
MPERRYSDDEVEAIFARASEAEQALPRRLPSRDGLTLTDLQQIGRGAGLAPELVAQAARSLDQPRQPVAPTFLGLPLGVARTVKLERRLTDEEWEHLVVLLRETFDARGVVRSEGSLRTWANGNLHVLVEPDGDGQRIRFRTVHGNARAMLLGGLGLMGVAAAFTIGAMLTDSMGFGDAVARVWSTAVIGAGLFGVGALRLPRWARLRRRQMDQLAERVTQA